MNQTKLPHIGGDIIMAIALGILNTLIYPVLRMIHHATPIKIAFVAIVLNFAAYLVVKMIPIGIAVVNVEGYILAASVVTIGSFLTNFFEMKRHPKAPEMPPQ